MLEKASSAKPGSKLENETKESPGFQPGSLGGKGQGASAGSGSALGLGADDKVPSVGPR